MHDYKLLIVKRPKNWRPRNHFEAPIKSVIVKEFDVASYEEAQEDVVRCNELSLSQDLSLWAVIQSPKTVLQNQVKLPDENA